MSKLQDQLTNWIEDLNWILEGDREFKVDQEVHYGMRDGEEVPKGYRYVLSVNGVEAVASVGSPKHVLAYLERIFEEPDVIVATAEHRIKLAEIAVDEAKAELTAAKEALPEAKAKAKELKKSLAEQAAAAEKVAGGTAAPEAAKKVSEALAEDAGYSSEDDDEMPPEIIGVGIESCPTSDDPNVHRVFKDGDEVGEVAKIREKKWQVTAPFNPQNYRTKTAAIEALTN
jgi:hypothetical protein